MKFRIKNQIYVIFLKNYQGKFLRLLEKGAFTKENLINDPTTFNKENDSTIDSDSEDDDDCSDDLEIDHDSNMSKSLKERCKLTDLDKSDELSEENITDEEENTEEYSDDNDDDDDYETLEESEEEGGKIVKNSDLENNSNKSV